MTRRACVVSVTVVVSMLAGCRAASTPRAAVAVARELSPAVNAGEALIRQGCYQCLLDAREMFDALPADPGKTDRLFAVNVLIGLRQAELAMDPAAAFAAAEALASSLPPAADAGFILALARAMPPDAAGTPDSIRAAHLDTTRTFWRGHPDAPARLARAGANTDLRAYLAAGLPCLTTAAGVEAGQVVAESPTDAARPLVAYRRATCPVIDAAALDALTATSPTFVEAAYFRARAPVLERAAAHVAMQGAAFQQARDAFPDSPSAAYSLASFFQTTGNCRAAVDAYDAVLALAPRHETAALQRIICLGFDGRHENAINAATRAIDADFPNVGDLLYWRAWNRHRLRQFAEARADIDQALMSRRSSETYTLAGIIKHDQGEFPAAERDLSAALQLDPSQCLARWYVGLIAFARELWLAAGDDFTSAADCYGKAVNEAERQLAAADSRAASAGTEAGQIAGLRAAIDRDRSQLQAARLNAANGFARGGAPDRARALLAAIPDDSPYAAAAQDLGRFLTESDAPAPEAASEPQR